MKCFESYTPGNRQINLGLLWEYKVDETNLQQFKTIIITRILQFGKLEDFYAGFDNFGGIDGFAQIAKNEVWDLDAKALNFLCHAFNMTKEETLCYKKTLSREKHLNS